LKDATEVEEDRLDHAAAADPWWRIRQAEIATTRRLMSSSR
jgi:hypothetical protein